MRDIIGFPRKNVFLHFKDCSIGTLRNISTFKAGRASLVGLGFVHNPVSVWEVNDNLPIGLVTHTGNADDFMQVVLGDDVSRVIDVTLCMIRLVEPIQNEAAGLIVDTTGSGYQATRGNTSTSIGIVLEVVVLNEFAFLTR